MMNDVILKALLERVKQGGMTLEQVPIPYKEEMEKLEEEELPKE